MEYREKEFNLHFGLGGIKVPSWKTLPSPEKPKGEILITIGCSNWNRDGSIEACIASMCEQNFPIENYEIILVDDKSTDNSREKIREKIKEYPNHNLTYIELKESRTYNEHHPHNVTIRLAKGKIFIKNSGDNIFSYNYLEGMWRHQNNVDNLFLTSRWTSPDINGKALQDSIGVFDKFDKAKPSISKFLLDKNNRTEEVFKAIKTHPSFEDDNPVDTGASMKTRDVQRIHGFDEAIYGRKVGDVCLMCRLTKIGVMFGFDDDLISMHYHYTSVHDKRDPKYTSETEWNADDYVKNKQGYGLIEDDEIVYKGEYRA